MTLKHNKTLVCIKDPLLQKLPIIFWKKKKKVLHNIFAVHNVLILMDCGSGSFTDTSFLLACYVSCNFSLLAFSSLACLEATLSADF